MRCIPAPEQALRAECIQAGTQPAFINKDKGPADAVPGSFRQRHYNSGADSPAVRYGMSLLEMRGINKSFSGVQVLKDVSLTVEKGEVHALLGENGAGKSTLMNILTGVYTRDSGTVVFDGQELKDTTVRDSEKAGIAFVHQELNLFNDLTVYENIFLGKEYTNKLGKTDKRRMIKEAEDLFTQLGVNVDPRARVSDLTTSQKQLLEISKALFFEAKLLILDEPTTALNNAEIEHLFGIIRGLKEKGTAFIFISHKMPEIFALSDSYTVFRNGEYIGSGKLSETDTDSIISMMVGRTYSSSEIYTPRETGDVVLKLDHFTGPGFHDINMEVRKGAVIGMTGLQGSGASELLQCMFGLTPSWGGTMTVNGEPVKHGAIRGAMRAGMGLLPSNRKETSVVPDMTIGENLSLAEQTLSSGKFHIHKKQEEQRYLEYKELLNIKAVSSKNPITSLSGGNQQKVFIARWLNTGAQILLFDNPTQGIDVGAKTEIYRLMEQLAGEGKTILFTSMEVPEIRKVADLCHVFYNGSIIGTLENDQIDETTVMRYSTNSINAQQTSDRGGES